MKNKMNLLFSVALLMVFFSCQQKEDSDLSQGKIEQSVNKEYRINKENLTKDLILAVNNTGSLSELVSELKGETGLVKLSDLKCVNVDFDSENKEAKNHGIVQVPELWIKEGRDSEKKNTILFSYAPDSPESTWEYIKAFDFKGNVYKLDVDVDPEYSVIVLEPDGKYALNELVDLMNEKLNKLGVQRQASVLKSSVGLETTVLKSIKLKNDHEPWIKGKSEIYAICSGIVEVNGEEKPQIRIIEMPYLDYQDVQYNPNQIMLFWKDYDYQAANIQLFEHDSNYNYKELVGILVTGTTKIVSAATGEPMLTIVGEIANQILSVMPSEWFTDDDDYVDSFYTLMKNKEYNNIMGASNNAKATFAPLFIPNNRR